ncbi:MAG: DUF4292 domain-containing protein, partial [Prevotella sp.]|nr:DUF4292 domain-containing protein [Prevotella sp.]
MKKSLFFTVIAFVCCVLSTIFISCGTKKAAIETPNTQHSTSTSQSSSPNTQAAISQFVKKVNDNAVYAKNISSKIDFTISRGGKDISVGGKLQMRRDEVIRIQLNVPLIGMEAGRLEFTKDYVLIVDRIHSEYVK